jgi:uncharacterized SAM-binding protein YcdF (DUF218 family)
MYFILSKVLLFILYPVLWVFALFIIALITKNPKRKQRLFIIGVIVLYVFSAPVFLNWVANAWGVNPPPAKENKVYSCAIILGGFSSEDKNGNGFFNETSDRFIQGVKLFITGKTTHLMVTGGNGNLIQGKFREGDWVKTQLQEFKIPDSSILIESNSRNTIENAVFSKSILQKAGLKPPYLLITSDFHMRRSYMIFKKEGYDVIPYPCNYLVGHSKASFSNIIPDGNALGEWNGYFKEMVGYVVDKYK